MPLPIRKVEPVFVSRGNLPEKHKIKDDLEAESHGTLTQVMLQLSSLSHHAEEIFGELVSAATEICKRSSSLKERLNRISEKMYLLNPDFEEYSLQDCVNTKTYQSSSSFDQQIISRGTMSAGMLQKFKSCHRPPPLENLNVFRDDGKDGLKFYSDPDYFFDLWRQQVLIDAETAAQKPHKPKKVGGRQGKKNKPVRAPQNRGKKHKHQAIQQGEHIMPTTATTTITNEEKPMEVGDGVLFMPEMPPTNPNLNQANLEEEEKPQIKHSKSQHGPGNLKTKQSRSSTDRTTLPPPPPPPGGAGAKEGSRSPAAPPRSLSLKQGHRQPEKTGLSAQLNKKYQSGAMEEGLPPPPPTPIPASFDDEMDLLMDAIQGLNDIFPTTPGSAEEMLPPPLPLPFEDDCMDFPAPPSPPPPHMDYTSPGDLPPPPPIYDEPIVQRSETRSYDSPVRAPTSAPPPPPSSKGPMAPPPPPPPPLIPDPPPGCPPPPPLMARDSIASALSNAPPLKKTVAPPPKVDSRSELLNAIRGGINLRKVEATTKEAKSSGLQSDVASILDGLKRIRAAVEISESESASSDGEDDSDW